MFDPVAYLLICDVLCIRYVEESSVASHLRLYSALKIGGECPCFECIQEDQYHEKTHCAQLVHSYCLSKEL